MTCYKFERSHWWNVLHDLLSSLNAVISTNESTQFITGHVTYKLAYTYKFRLKTTQTPAPIFPTAMHGCKYLYKLMKNIGKIGRS